MKYEEAIEYMQKSAHYYHASADDTDEALLMIAEGQLKAKSGDKPNHYWWRCMRNALYSLWRQRQSRERLEARLRGEYVLPKQWKALSLYCRKGHHRTLKTVAAVDNSCKICRAAYLRKYYAENSEFRMQQHARLKAWRGKPENRAREIARRRWRKQQKEDHA